MIFFIDDARGRQNTTHSWRLIHSIHAVCCYAHLIECPHLWHLIQTVVPWGFSSCRWLEPLPAVPPADPPEPIAESSVSPMPESTQYNQYNIIYLCSLLGAMCNRGWVTEYLLSDRLVVLGTWEASYYKFCRVMLIALRGRIQYCTL